MALRLSPARSARAPWDRAAALRNWRSRSPNAVVVSCITAPSVSVLRERGRVAVVLIKPSRRPDTQVVIMGAGTGHVTAGVAQTRRRCWGPSRRQVLQAADHR